MNPIKELGDEMLELNHFFFEVKNELEGTISLMLEDVFDDLLCIEATVGGLDTIIFTIDEGDRWVTEMDIENVEIATQSRWTGGLNFEVKV